MIVNVLIVEKVGTGCVVVQREHLPLELVVVPAPDVGVIMPMKFIQVAFVNYHLVLREVQKIPLIQVI